MPTVLPSEMRLAAVEDVEIVGLDSYITTENGLEAGLFGGWDGWNYRVNGKSPSVGINDYVLTDGRRNSAFYYGMFDMQIPEVFVCGRRADLTSTVRLMTAAAIPLSRSTRLSERLYDGTTRFIPRMRTDK